MRRPTDRRVEAAIPADTTRADTVYPQSVSSGGPTPTGVICWTRIDPDVYRAEADLFVELEPVGDPYTDGQVASLDTATDGARSAPDGTAIDPTYRRRVADGPDPAADYTVRVDLDGHLESGTRYRYRFVYDGVASRVGECQTLPAPTDSPASVSFAVLACQDYQNGYYGAHGHVARGDVDFMLHLGDFIYDSAEGQYRGLGADDFADREVTLPSGDPLASSLADFRELYRTYLSDPLLGAAVAAHTTIRTWDDHAVADNRFWDYEVDAPVAPNHPRGDDPEFMRQLVAAGIQAFYEYTPARVVYDPDADHLHDRFRLYSSVAFGDLLTLFVTDERLFRSPPPCTDSLRPGWGPICGERTDPDRTMLGTEQREWLLAGFETTTTSWTGWANEVLSLPFQVGIDPVSISPLADSWNGYPAERALIFDAMAANDDTAFVTLTGDLHSAIVGEQRHDGTRVGIECMTPATTSVNVAEAVALDEGRVGELTQPILSAAVEAMNPTIDQFDSNHWGYATATFTPEQFGFDVYAVDKTVNRAAAPKSKLLGATVPRTQLL